MFYVYSSLANANDFDGVIIQGGAYVTNNFLVTPNAVVTPITAEQKEILEKNEAFKQQVDNGYIKITKTQEKAEKIGNDLNSTSTGNALTKEELELDKKKA